MRGCGGGPTQNNKMIHTVFTVDDSAYLRWQADLLAYTFRKVGQPGPLTRVWAGHGTPPPFDGLTYQTPPYTVHPLTGDHHPPYNLVMPLLHWLMEAPPAEETMLFMDPDVVFLTPLVEEVKPGEPIGQYHGYMEAEHNAALIRSHCHRPDLYQPVFSPMLIHRDDLRSLTPVWMEHFENIRDDPVSRDAGGWISSMYSLAFAAVDLGLRFDMRVLAAFQYEDISTPLVHYCHHSQDAEGLWRWDKRTYQPWADVPPPSASVPLASQSLIREVNEYARFRRNNA